jgi:hypothetical protein
VTTAQRLLGDGTHTNNNRLWWMPYLENLTGRLVSLGTTDWLLGLPPLLNRAAFTCNTKASSSLQKLLHSFEAVVREQAKLLRLMDVVLDRSC